MSLILSKIEGGETELTEHDLRHVTGGTVDGESMDDKHRSEGGYGPTSKPTKTYVPGSSWLGGKV
jgi:hypothetical protein